MEGDPIIRWRVKINCTYDELGTFLSTRP